MNIRQIGSQIADTFAALSAIYGGNARLAGEYVVPRLDTAANWTAVNPVLGYLEIGYESDTGLCKIGNAATAWASLPYFTPKLNNIPAPTGTVSMGNQFVSSVASPFFGTDAANKNYVDGIVQIDYKNQLLPNGAKFQTLDRMDIVANNNTVLTSGTLYLVGISLPIGTVITSISAAIGNAPTTPTNQWFGLFDSSRVALRLTTDNTTTVPAANSIQTINLTSSFTTTYSGLHYLGIMNAAATPSSLWSVADTAFNPIGPTAPITAGTSTTGLTAPPAAGTTATAITYGRFKPYMYVS